MNDVKAGLDHALGNVAMRYRSVTPAGFRALKQSGTYVLQVAVLTAHPGNRQAYDLAAALILQAAGYAPYTEEELGLPPRTERPTGPARAGGVRTQG